MKITLEQYQSIYALSTGLTSSQYTKEVLRIFNVDGNKYTIKEIKQVIDDIKIPEVTPLKKFRLKIDGKEYGVSESIMKSSFNEWIQFESLVGSSPTEADTIKNLHRILAVYVRPIEKKWFRKRMVSLEDMDMEENQNAMKKLSVQEALSINVFFYLQELNFIQFTRKRYLNQLNQEIQMEEEFTENK